MRSAVTRQGSQRPTVALIPGEGPYTPIWMLSRVSRETSPHHARAAETRLSAMDVTSTDEYRSFLLRIYGFEAPIERAAQRVAELDPAFVREHTSCARLNRDLRALGVDDNELAGVPTHAPVTFRSAPEALGWVFVIERQMQLAGLIRRHLQRRLGADLPSSYFDIESPGGRLRALGQALCAWPRDACKMVAAANEAFRAQQHWYRVGSEFVADAGASLPGVERGVVAGRVDK